MELPRVRPQQVLPSVRLLLRPIAAAGLLASIGLTAAHADSLDAIPMPGGGSFGVPHAISADGSTVVGEYSDSSSFLFAFRWPGSGTASDLGFLGAPINGTIAWGVNADGTVVVGTSASQAFRWTQATGMVGLGSLDPFGLNTSAAYGVSGDGTIVVGQTTSPGFQTSGGEAFRWTQGTGMAGLGSLDTLANIAKFSKATAISTDGQVIVGQSTSDTYTTAGEAFRWQGGTMTGLGTLTGPGASSYSIANAVSANGSVVVGQSSSGTIVDLFGGSGEAFRWTQATGMQGLGALNPTDFQSSALAVNGDGSVVVGFSQNSSFQNVAFRWTQTTGMRSIASILTAGGVNVANWSFDQATGVSADGTLMVGSGTDPNGNPQAWIARVSASGTGVITPQIVAQSFAGLAALTQGSTGKTDANLATQTGIATDHACGACAFVYGVGGTVPGDPFGAGALGFKANIARDVAAGISFGAEAGRTKLVYDGSAATRGGLGSVFVARTPEAGLQLIAALSGEVLDADITRGYLNGNSAASSSGSTKGYSYGAMLRAGWAFNATHNIRLTPFASYTAARAHFDGWTETTGVFPARFEAIDQTLSVVRLGSDARYTFAPGSWVWGGLNWAHRPNSTAPQISGSLLGLFTMTVPGATLDRDYLETTAGLRVPIGRGGALSGSITAAASANDPVTYLGRIVASHAF
ncbi:MAG: autotransporter domain-containing protein [Xanthobacteraceae bacterium]|nr:autotransporter domain-containing protein [Xanthobacteraceae bacterium]